MKGHAARPALSAPSISLLLIAVAGAVVSVVRDGEPVRRVAAWIRGIGMVALVASVPVLVCR